MRLSSEEVEGMIEDVAREGNEDGVRVSWLDVVLGHVWRCV